MRLISNNYDLIKAPDRTSLYSMYSTSNDSNLQPNSSFGKAITLIKSNIQARITAQAAFFISER